MKRRKNKIKYNHCLHFLLLVTSLAFDTNRVRCQRRQDAVLVKRLKLIVYHNIQGHAVATDLRVLYFPPTDDLQDTVCYDIKLVLISESRSLQADPSRNIRHTVVVLHVFFIRLRCFSVVFSM